MEQDKFTDGKEMKLFLSKYFMDVKILQSKSLESMMILLKKRNCIFRFLYWRSIKKRFLDKLNGHIKVTFFFSEK